MSLVSAHWTAVNGELPSPLELRGGLTLAMLTALEDDLDESLDDVESLLSDKEIARADVELKKAAVLSRAQEFGRKLRGTLEPGEPFLAAVPEMPVQTSAEGKFLQPMRDVTTLWGKMNTIDFTLLLSDDYSKSDFDAAVTALKAAYGVLNTAIMNLAIGRSDRDKIMAQVRALLGAYRPGVEGALPPGSPLVNTIPRLSAAPGHTPDPVVLSASYDAVENESVLTFSESDDTTLEKYEVRAVPGPEYDAEDETLIATIAAGEPREFRTGFSLDNPGMAASFRVYVILETGNEAASNTATVTRPG